MLLVAGMPVCVLICPHPSSLGSGDADPGGQFEQFLHHILMNESSHAGAPPAADQAIAALKRCHYP